MTQPANDLFGFNSGDLGQDTVRYASGVLSPAIWEGYRRAGRAMCIAASEASSPALDRACRFVAAGGELLVDSGAFLYRNNPDQMPWERVLTAYRAISEAAVVPVVFILPDVVGCQSGTLAMLRRWGRAMQSIIQPPHTLLLPVQVGSRSPGVFVKEALLCLDRPIDGLALPSAAAAFAPSQIPLLSEVPAVVPRRVHFLGISRNSKGLNDRLFRLQEMWPDAKVSCDACEHRAMVGIGNPITDARKEALESYWDEEIDDWDETEDDDVQEASEALLRAQFPDLDDEAIENLLLSSWGVISETRVKYRAFEKTNGPKATSESIYRYASDTLPTQTDGAIR